MGYTQHRLVTWQEVMGADGEKIFAWGGAVVDAQYAVAAGTTQVVSGRTVPTGYIYVWTVAVAYDSTSTGANCLLRVNNGVTAYSIARKINTALNEGYTVTTSIPLPAGWCLECNFTNVVLGDTVILNSFGYQMVIP